MPKISRQAIANKIINGIENAHKEHDKWSGGKWLSRAPEYLMTTNIARSLTTIDCNNYVTLEHSPRSLLRDSGALTKGRLNNNIRADGRVDIVLWWGKADAPRTVIEVKNNVGTYAHIKCDIDRVVALLKKNTGDSSLQFGAVAFYVDRKDKSSNIPAKDLIVNIIKKIEAKAIEDHSKSFKIELVHKLRIDDDRARASACLMLTPLKCIS